MILNENDYQAFVASIDLLSLHCPVCGVVGLFILYGHYKRFVITDDTSNDCKINIRVQRIQCTQCRKLILFLILSSFIFSVTLDWLLFAALKDGFLFLRDFKSKIVSKEICWIHEE